MERRFTRIVVLAVSLVTVVRSALSYSEYFHVLSFQFQRAIVSGHQQLIISPEFVRVGQASIQLIVPMKYLMTLLSCQR